MGEGGLTEWLLQTVGAVAEPAAVVVDAAEPLINVVARLRAAGRGAAVVVDAAGAVSGVVNADTILQRVVFDVTPQQPIQTVLTDRPQLVQIDEPLHRAIGRLAQEQQTLLVVVDAAGRPRGLLSWQGAIAAAVSDLVSRLAAAAAGDDVAGLASAKAAQPGIVAALLAAHQPAVAAMQFINAANLDLTRRFVDGTITALAADGWGEPPVPFAVIVMGSAGRGESLLNPDQDNGFVLADYADTDHARIDGYFIELAQRLTRDLDAAGFPLCVGNVMAINPVWRKSLRQWCDQIDSWMRQRTNLAILYADIFFDFRLAYGRADLVEALRRHSTAVTSGNLPFLNQLIWQQTEQPAAIGLFGRLLTGQQAEHPGAIDVKLHGLLPLVELTRLLALKAGIADTSTLARLAALRATGDIDADRHDELAQCFVFLVDLLLRQQLWDRETGQARGNYVAAESLPSRQRQQLVATVKSIESLRRQVIQGMVGMAGLSAG